MIEMTTVGFQFWNSVLTDIKDKTGEDLLEQLGLHLLSFNKRYELDDQVIDMRVVGPFRQDGNKWYKIECSTETKKDVE